MPQHSFKRWMQAAALALAVSLTACGDGAGTVSIELPDATSQQVKFKKQNAARFLTQATFGPTDASIQEVQNLGYEEWINRQFTLNSESHLNYINNIRVNGNQNILPEHFYQSFWKNASQSDAQLRERVKFALSEIFVVSLADPNVNIDGAASYYDMLGNNAFGNYRELLEQVALHPQMGVYLTHMGNQKEDTTTGRNPDENFAREILQLMSIGTVELNMDGTPVKVKGETVPAYYPSDIKGLAKVFTGFSWSSESATPSDYTFFGGDRHTPARRLIHTQSMIPYARFHSTSEKAFLGKEIPAGSTNARADLEFALDVLAEHPNVPPFMAQQLIQRLVTSNPSEQYVKRVATVFKNTKGDMKAVIKAILLDSEATTVGTRPGSGKIREPIIRLANWMRAFNARSASNNFLIESTAQKVSLGQSPLTAPSVFNFYRPGYVPPNTDAGKAGLKVPEFQIVDEVTVAGYINFVELLVDQGIGTRPAPGLPKDVGSTYARELAVADNAGKLADRMNDILMYGQMPPALRRRIIDSVNGRPIPTGTARQEDIDAAKLDRVKLAIYQTMISPDYLVQR